MISIQSAYFISNDIYILRHKCQGGYMRTSNIIKLVGVLCCCWLAQAQAASVCNAYSNSTLNSICTKYCDSLDCDNPQHDPSLNLQCIANFFKWKLASNGAAIPCPSDALMVSNTINGIFDQTATANVGDEIHYTITVVNQSNRYVNVTSVADEFNNASPTTPISCIFNQGSAVLPGWLAPMSSTSCSFAHTISEPAGSSFTNTALVNGQYILGQKVKPASATSVVNVNQLTIVPSVLTVGVYGTCQTPNVGSTTFTVAINSGGGSIPALNVSLSSGALVTQTNNCDGSVNPCSITVAIAPDAQMPLFPGSQVDVLNITAPNGAMVSLNVIGARTDRVLCLLQ